MRTQRSAPKVADFFRGELVKKSTQDHPAKTRSRRGLEKRSAIVYPVQVSNFFLSVRYETLCLTRSLRIWKLDRVRVHWGVRKSWGFEGNTRMHGKWQHHELLPRCRDGQDHWKTLQQRNLPNYDCRFNREDVKNGHFTVMLTLSVYPPSPLSSGFCGVFFIFEYYYMCSETDFIQKLFSYNFLSPLNIPQQTVRDGWHHQIEWIFGKVPKGGKRGSFQSKNLCCRFWGLYSGLFQHEIDAL